jgi:hypothetical protein
MQRIYEPGETVPAVIHTKDPDPTVYVIEPMMQGDKYRLEALMGKVRQKYLRFAETTDQAVFCADKEVEQESMLLATRIHEIRNAWPDGKTLSDKAEILNYITKSTPDDREALLQMCQSSTLLEKCRKP